MLNMGSPYVDSLLLVHYNPVVDKRGLADGYDGYTHALLRGLICPQGKFLRDIAFGRGSGTGGQFGNTAVATWYTAASD
jgi:hypothetical protein